MEGMKRSKIPEFGNWEYCDEMPITQYFESARQAGMVRAAYYGEAGEEDLFRVPVAVPAKSAYRDGHFHRKVRKGSHSSGGEEKPYSKEQKQRKQGMVSGEAAPAAQRRRPKPAPKAVDEDLYKIPPELLYQKPKRKRLLGNMLTGCLGLNCVA